MVACAGQPGAGLQRKQAYITPDHGRTWHCLASPPGSGYLEQVSISPAGTIALSGSRSDVYISWDHGRTWHGVADTTPSLNAAYQAGEALAATMTTSTHGFIVTPETPYPPPRDSTSERCGSPMTAATPGNLSPSGSRTSHQQRYRKMPSEACRQVLQGPEIVAGSQSARRAPPSPLTCVIPAKRPGLLGTDAGQQANDGIGAEPGASGGLHQGGRLLGGQRLARPAALALRGINQSRGVMEDMPVCFGMTEGSGQRVVRDHDRPAGMTLREPR